MTDNRIIDISGEGARLSLKHKNLVITREGKDQVTMPLKEIAALSVSNQAVTFTQPLLAGLASNGVIVVISDEKHLPAGMLYPLAGHFVQGERFARQVSVGEPMKKRIWQQIVKAKVKAQGKLLKEIRDSDHGLILMADRVMSGDKENVEGAAARRYWTALFNDKKFKRRREGKDQNRLLNYGYAVLRAIVARAICSVGLHPSFGLHHHNRYDAFCLADDLIEPFRPVVDKVVVGLVENYGSECEFTTEVKAALLEPLTGRFKIKGEERTLFEAVSRMASSLVGVYEGKRKTLEIPEII